MANPPGYNGEAAVLSSSERDLFACLKNFGLEGRHLMSYTPSRQLKYSSKPMKAGGPHLPVVPPPGSQLLVSFRRELVPTSEALVLVAATQRMPLGGLARTSMGFARL